MYHQTCHVATNESLLPQQPSVMMTLWWPPREARVLIFFRLLWLTLPRYKVLIGWQGGISGVHDGPSEIVDICIRRQNYFIILTRNVSQKIGPRRFNGGFPLIWKTRERLQIPYGLWLVRLFFFSLKLPSDKGEKIKWRYYDRQKQYLRYLRQLILGISLLHSYHTVTHTHFELQSLVTYLRYMQIRNMQLSAWLIFF